MKHMALSLTRISGKPCVATACRNFSIVVDEEAVVTGYATMHLEKESITIENNFS